MTRLEANLEILDELIIFFNKPGNKDIRFFQGLQILGIQSPLEIITNHDEVSNVIDDNFYEESQETLNKLINK